MTHHILFALWFLLAAAFGNVAPILSNKIPGVNRWNTPIDGGRKFRGKQIFGSHKTWRGLVSGIILATVVLWLQQIAIRHYVWAADITKGADLTSYPTLILGPLFGIGALGGDAIESFFKRQRAILSGESWMPYDQIDYIIGGVIVSLPFVILPFVEYVWIFAVWFVMHLISSYIGWLIGFKEKPI
jgi:CDP-2,3-bis-(O-geranylgeranyl)-sn-glycerol synthase